MKDSSSYKHQKFLDCNWIYNTPDEDRYGYISVMGSLNQFAKEMAGAGKTEQSEIFELLARAASMVLTASSINEPFTAYFQDFQSGRRTVLPGDFLPEDLDFFEVILNDVNELSLKARLADLLWLLKSPRNPDFAKVAIDSYVNNVIDGETWHKGIKECWERAARLCIQIKDFERLNSIKMKLFSAAIIEYSGSKFISLGIADLLSRLKIDSDIIERIAESMYGKAIDFKSVGDFYTARSYFELASKKYGQCSNETLSIAALIAMAECFDMEGDSRVGDSNMVANSFYENAIQAYRKIPVKNRASYNVEEKIKEIREKMTKTGQASLSEMGVIKTTGVDISELVEASTNHVAGKRNPTDALMFFTGLYKGADYESAVTSAKETIKGSFFSSMFASSHMSSDGRVIAKTPAMNLNAGEADSANKSALNRQVYQNFSIEIQLVVQGRIMPAMYKICMEHRFTKELLVSICSQSPIVPKGREQLLGHALWLGFEHEFGSAIHLLCPQFEHIVRMQLKAVGALTSNIDKNGIENENGLSTLMDLPESLQVFGEDLSFEIKCIFTESLGFNLRNQVAHGLLNDDDSSSMPTVYAWWMILRLVIKSIFDGCIK